MQCATCCTAQTQFVVFNGCPCATAPDKHVCQTCARKAVENAFSYTCMFCRRPFSGAVKAHVSALVPDKLRVTTEAWPLPQHRTRAADEAFTDVLMMPSDDGEILSDDDSDDDDSDADEDGNLEGFIDNCEHVDVDAAVADLMLQHLLTTCR